MKVRRLSPLDVTPWKVLKTTASRSSRWSINIGYPRMVLELVLELKPRVSLSLAFFRK